MTKRAAALVGAAAAALVLVSPPAWATTSDQGGTATTGIRYTEDVWTATGSKISVNYTNGIGLGGNNRLYLRVCKFTSGSNTFDCSANDAVGVTDTGKTYQLGKLSKGTKFRIQYRAASSPGANTYWQGTFTY